MAIDPTAPPNNGEGYQVAVDSFPDQYPTHIHPPEFWEGLGRTVATFGFLENVLARAIFALTGTKEYSEDQLAEAMAGWLSTIEKALSDTLVPLIGTYQRAVREHHAASKDSLDALVSELRDLAEFRNVLCHGFWQKPDQMGFSVPLYVRGRDKLKFDTPVDTAFLRQIRQATIERAAEVINSVTRMGYKFPGTSGPGKPVA